MARAFARAVVTVELVQGKGACDEAAMEWLWDIATTATCADVRLAARDALLVALGFECKWGAVCDGREARFDYRPPRAIKWVPCCRAWNSRRARRAMSCARSG